MTKKVYEHYQPTVVDPDESQRINLKNKSSRVGDTSINRHVPIKIAKELQGTWKTESHFKGGHDRSVTPKKTNPRDKSRYDQAYRRRQNNLDHSMSSNQGSHVRYEDDGFEHHHHQNGHNKHHHDTYNEHDWEKNSRKKRRIKKSRAMTPPPGIGGLHDDSYPELLYEEPKKRVTPEDAFYQKKMKYLEQKALIIAEVKRRQDLKDLRNYGQIPTINEKSKKLAELHKLKQKIIADEKFLKKTFNREKNGFEILGDPNFEYTNPKVRKPFLANSLEECQMITPSKFTTKPMPKPKKVEMRKNYGLTSNQNKVYSYNPKEFKDMAYGDFYDRQMKHWHDVIHGGYISRMVDADDLNLPPSRPKKMFEGRRAMTPSKSAPKLFRVFENPNSLSPVIPPSRLPEHVDRQENRKRVEENQEQQINTYHSPRYQPFYNSQTSMSQSPDKTLVSTNMPYGTNNKPVHNHDSSLSQHQPPRRNPSFSTNPEDYPRLPQRYHKGRGDHKYTDIPVGSSQKSVDMGRKNSFGRQRPDPLSRLSALSPEGGDRSPDYPDDMRQTVWTSGLPQDGSFLTNDEIRRSNKKLLLRDNAYNPFYQ